MNQPAPDSPSQRAVELESRFAWLERHVSEQDSAIHELGEEVRRLRREVQDLRRRLQAAAEGGPAAESDERPPHY